MSKSIISERKCNSQYLMYFYISKELTNLMTKAKKRLSVIFSVKVKKVG